MTVPKSHPGNQLAFSIETPRPQALLPGRPFHQWLLNQQTPWCLFFKSADGYLLRFPGLADFTVSRDGLHITTLPVPGISLPTLEHLYLNQVQPLAFSRQHKLMLHGSAVEIDDFAVAFLGQSGQGKSTLAACFATHGRRFLTDDGLQLTKIGKDYHVQPSHPSIRLWQDSFDAVAPSSAVSAALVHYAPKLRLLADDVVAWCDAARLLRCIYVLGNADVTQITITAVPGRDAMLALVQNSFLLDIDEREMLKHHFAELADLSRNQLLFRLDFPWGYQHLAQVRHTVITHAALVRMPAVAAAPQDAK